MAKSIIAELYRVLVVQRAVAAITGALGNMGGFFGSLFPARAQGGAVSANRPYVVGEKGPEMLVPSTSGRVIPNNQLGGGSGGQVIVNQTINVSTGVQQTVRTEIKQLMPQIAESAKQAVVDAKRRGGSYGRAFA
jgi:SLT domain-containing protein